MRRPLSEPPERFDAEQSAIWKEILDLSPPGMLQPIDRYIVEVAVSLIVRCRGENACRGDFTQVESVLSKCGLAPRSRAKIMRRFEQKTSTLQ